jgi:hypothetical protein
MDDRLPHGGNGSPYSDIFNWIFLFTNFKMVQQNIEPIIF